MLVRPASRSQRADPSIRRFPESPVPRVLQGESGEQEQKLSWSLVASDTVVTAVTAVGAHRLESQ